MEVRVKAPEDKKIQEVCQLRDWVQARSVFGVFPSEVFSTESSTASAEHLLLVWKRGTHADILLHFPPN